MVNGSVIGIDLGTVNSCVSVWINDHVEIIENSLNHRTTASYVSFYNNERLFGDNASYKVNINPENTIFDIKRLIGLSYNDKNVQLDRRYWPFKVIEKVGKPYIQVEFRNEKRELAPEEIASMIISNMKEVAENYLGQTVSDAVISVPSYFNNSQRRAIINAGTIAGLNTVRLINEPTAAAITYSINNKISYQENVLIIDLGGGTYDVSLVDIENGNIKVKDVAGDSHLGGEDFTNNLIEYCIIIFKEKYGKDISTNPRALSRLRTACEKAKTILSTLDEAFIEIDCLYENINFYTSITRSRFEELNSNLFDKIIKPINKVLKNLKLKTSAINEIVLIGGSSRIPKVQKIISSYFNGKIINKTVNCDEGVAYGSTVLASLISGEIPRKMIIKDIIPYSICIKYSRTENENDDITIIDKNTIIPFKKVITFNFKSVTNYDDESLFSLDIKENRYKKLYKYYVKGTTPSFKNKIKISFTFEVDINGVLNISFSSSGISFEKWLRVDYSGNLSKKSINYIKDRMEEDKKYDKEEKERKEYMNNLEKDLYTIRMYLKDEEAIQKMVSNYINNFISNINSKIEWIKNNQDANIEDMNNIKILLEENLKPIREMNILN